MTTAPSVAARAHATHPPVKAHMRAHKKVSGRKVAKVRKACDLQFSDDPVRDSEPPNPSWDQRAVTRRRTKARAITPGAPTCLACGGPMVLRQLRAHDVCLLALAAVP
jgi:hypothetical protein